MTKKSHFKDAVKCFVSNIFIEITLALYVISGIYIYLSENIYRWFPLSCIIALLIGVYITTKAKNKRQAIYLSLGISVIILSILTIYKI